MKLWKCIPASSSQLSQLPSSLIVLRELDEMCADFKIWRSQKFDFRWEPCHQVVLNAFRVPTYVWSCNEPKAALDGVTIMRSGRFLNNRLELVNVSGTPL